MKNFDQVIEGLNFKKIIRIYLVFILIAGIFSTMLLGYTFKDKLLFAYNYNKVNEKIEDGKLGVDDVKNDIAALAGQSADIIDILILDRKNKVSFSAKNSEFASAGEFTLERSKNEENGYLTYSQNPNITFRLMRIDEMLLSTVLLDHEKSIAKNHKDNIFYEDNFNSQQIYLLNYTADKNTGNKIYFISNVHPVTNGPLYIELIGALATLIFMLYWVLLAFWVYQNARKSKLNALLWGIITLFTNLAGLFIYLIYKQNNQICFKCGAVQSKGIYCVYCGTKISQTCAQCNAIVNNGDHFCSRCGTEIPNEAKD